MNHIGAARRDERPGPVVIHDGVVIPGALCAELTGALQTLQAFVQGTPPPAACRAPRLSRAVAAVMAATEQAAVDYRRRETQRSAHAAASATAVTVLTPAQTAARSSQEEITTEQVADILGVTASRVRQLAASGQLPGRKTARDVWLFDPETVRGYRDNPGRTGTRGNTDLERASGRGAA